MKSISLHPASLAIGALGGALALLAISAQAFVSTPIPTNQVRVVGHIPADWWIYHHLHYDGSGSPIPFVVPSDRYLVVTLMNGTPYVDGVPFDGGLPVSCGNSVSPGLVVDRNGSRIVFPPGTVLSCSPFNTSLVDLWGYLEPVR